MWITTLGGDNGLAASIPHHGTMLWFGSINGWVVNLARDHPDVRVVVMDPIPTPELKTPMEYLDNQTANPTAETSTDKWPNLAYSKYDRKNPLPWADKSTTSVLVEDLFLHKSNQLDEVFRVLSPGGRALFHTMTPIWKSECHNVIATYKAIAHHQGLSDGLAPGDLLTALQMVGFVDVSGEKVSWVYDELSGYQTLSALTHLLRIRALVYLRTGLDDELSTLRREIVLGDKSLEVHGEFCYATAPSDPGQEKGSTTQLHRTKSYA